ncbi:MAG: hypothetical protein OEV79_01215 [candidate division WOR-3 bacterium]|nr:hypothetical protein [candidate division WOR-3 bacterium]
MIALLFLISIESSLFLRLSPGVVSQGLGGSSVLIDEGLPVFHNPACSGAMSFNFTLSRWLYGTNYLTCGGVYRNTMFGITYMNYGRIQGYDEAGNPTTVFTPYDFCAGIGYRFGLIGLVVKGFVEQIDNHSMYGLCATIGTRLQYKALSIGAKVDNLGKEFAENTSIPLFTALGIKYSLTSGIDFLAEIKVPLIEFNTGIVYTYRDLKLLLGCRYLQPENLTGESNTSISFDDVSLTGGISVSVESYDIGYSIAYGNLSIAHQFSVTFIPHAVIQ